LSDRERLIQLAEAGELTPEAAEAEAAKSALGHLAGGPPANQF
jgi:hypothetical protein